MGGGMPGMGGMPGGMPGGAQGGADNKGPQVDEVDWNWNLYIYH